MNIITIGQILAAVAIIVLILLQDRSSGVGGLFGGGSGGGEFHQGRRGMEKIMFTATIVAVSSFAVLSLLNLII